MGRMQSKYDIKAVQIWHKCSADMAQMQSKYDTKAVQIWLKCSADMAQMQSKYDIKAVQIWHKPLDGRYKVGSVKCDQKKIAKCL